MAHVIRSVFEEYGAPLVNTVYDDPRTEHIFDAMAGKNAGYWIVADDGVVLGGCGYYPTEGLPDGYAELVKFYLSPLVRGQGNGAILFSQAIEEARRAGCAGHPACGKWRFHSYREGVQLRAGKRSS